MCSDSMCFDVFCKAAEQAVFSMCINGNIASRLERKGPHKWGKRVKPGVCGEGGS